MSALQRLLHDPVFHRLGLTLVHFLWQGLALALLALLLRGLLRRAAPALRYLVLLGLFVTMAAAPVLTFTFWTKAPPPAVMTIMEMERRLAIAAQQQFVPAPAPSSGPDAQPTVRPPQLSPPAWVSDRLQMLWWQVGRRLPVAGRLWMLGVLLLTFRLLVQWSSFLRVIRRAHSLDEERWRGLLASLSTRLGVRRVTRLVQSGEVGMPTAAGWLRPVILLPPAVLLGLSPEQLEAVLAHELAHIRRHDFLVNVFQRIVEVLLFYHPAVWWVSGLIRLERELCCDDLAVAVCGDRVTYARALKELESTRAPAAALSMARAPVTARVRRLLPPVEAGRRPLSWSTVLFPALALTAIVLISTIAPVNGQPYIPGTLFYGEAPLGQTLTARVRSGRSEWRVEGAPAFSVRAYSPAGDAVIFRRDNGYAPREWGVNDLWEAPVEQRGRPSIAHAVNLIARAGLPKGDHWGPAWSPDGRRVLFTRVPIPAPPKWCHTMQLWVMNADGSGAHEVRIPGRTINGWGTQWTPDGSQILASVRNPKDPGCAMTHCGTVVIDVDGGGVRELPLRFGAVSPDGSSVIGIWSDPPDGVAARDDGRDWYKPAGTYRWELVLMRLDGTGRRTLRRGSHPQASLPADPHGATNALTPRGFAWSPDGQQFAFVAALDWDPKGPPINRQVELYIYDLPSDRLIQVTDDDLEQCTPVWME